MRTFLFAAAAALITATAHGVAAAPARDAIAGGEIRRNAEFGGIERYEVLRLAADGTFTGYYEKMRPVTRGSAETWSGAMRGRWSLEGSVICFEGVGLEYRGRSCYTLTKAGVGANQWAGTHAQSGDVWQFFFSPPGG
jgi:hypothetical protein